MIYNMIWYMIRAVWCDIYDIYEIYDIWYDIWYKLRYMIRYDMIYLLTAIGLTPGGSSTVHIYTQTIHRTTQITTEQHKWQQNSTNDNRTTQLIWEECRPCPVFAGFTLAFALQLRKKHGKTSVRVAEECIVVDTSNGHVSYKELSKLCPIQ